MPVETQIILNRKDFLIEIFGQYLKECGGFIETREFINGEGGPIRKFYGTVEEIAAHNPKGDYYFGVCPRETTENGKKDNINTVCALWIDLDYGEEGHKKKSKFATQEEALSEARKFEHKPSIVVDSGRGLHVYWLLKEPEEIKDIPYIEGIIKGITRHLGGDIGTQDISRILRVPETDNLKIPTVSRPCRVIEFNKEARYNLSVFEHYAISLATSQPAPNISFPNDLPKIDIRKLKVDSHIKELIKDGNAKGLYESRSECDLAVINALVLTGYDEGAIKSIFSDPKRKISEKYLEKVSKNQSADSYLAHQIGKAQVLKKNIDEINLLLKEGKVKDVEAEIDKLPEQYKKIYKNRLKEEEGELFKIFQADNRYFKIVQSRQGESYIPISNFVIKIKNRYITAGECTREVCFVNMKGSTTDGFILEPQQMASPTRFKEFCLSKGNFLFEGTDKELMELWKLEFSKDEGKVIYQPDHVGCLKEHGIWLFDNCAIKDSKLIHPDDDGVIWIDDCGYKSLRLNFKDIENLPQLKILSSDELLKLETWSVDTLKKNIGGYEAWLAIGCAKAWVYSHEIFKAHGFFPFLFLYGKTRCGKDTLASWLLSLYGILKTEVESLPEMTSPVGVARKAGYFSSLPVWVDEYRNEKRITRFNGFFRNLFNRTGASKGLKADFGTYSPEFFCEFDLKPVA